MMKIRIIFLGMLISVLLSGCNNLKTTNDKDNISITEQSVAEKDTETTKTQKESIENNEVISKEIEMYNSKINKLYQEAIYKYPDKHFFAAEIYSDDENGSIAIQYSCEEYTIIDNCQGVLLLQNDNNSVEISYGSNEEIMECVFLVHMETKEDGRRVIILEKENYINLQLERNGAVLSSDVKENGYLCFYADSLEMVEIKDNFKLESDETARVYLFDSLSDGIHRAVWYEYDLDRDYWNSVYEYENVQLIGGYQANVGLRYEGKYIELPWSIMNFGPGCGMDFYLKDVTGDGREDVVLNYSTREENVYFVYDLDKKQDISPVYNEYVKLDWSNNNLLLDNIVLYDEHVEVIMHAVNVAYEEAGIENTYATTFEEYKEKLDSYYFLDIEWNDDGELVFDLNDSEIRVDGAFEFNGEGYNLRVDSVELVF